MEKIICTGCGAPITPNTTQAFLTCEYCDTAINNAYYVESEAKAADEPAAEEIIQPAEELLTQETLTVGSVVATVAKSLLGGALLRRTVLNRGTVQRPSVIHPARQPSVIRPHARREAPQRPGPGAAPQHHPQPNQRMSRPGGMMRPGGGPGGRGGMGGPGSRGGMGGPGGRGRR